jgi:hypothetical protein
MLQRCATLPQFSPRCALLTHDQHSRIDDPSKRRGIKRVDESKGGKKPPAKRAKVAYEEDGKWCKICFADILHLIDDSDPLPPLWAIDSSDSDSEMEEPNKPKSSIKKVIKKGAAPVDAPSNFGDTHHVVMSLRWSVLFSPQRHPSDSVFQYATKSDIWDCMLNQTVSRHSCPFGSVGSVVAHTRNVRRRTSV